MTSHPHHPHHIPFFSSLHRLSPPAIRQPFAMLSTRPYTPKVGQNHMFYPPPILGHFLPSQLHSQTSSSSDPCFVLFLWTPSIDCTPWIESACTPTLPTTTCTQPPKNLLYKFIFSQPVFHHHQTCPDPRHLYHLFISHHGLPACSVFGRLCSLLRPPTFSHLRFFPSPRFHFFKLFYLGFSSLFSLHSFAAYSSFALPYRFAYFSLPPTYDLAPPLSSTSHFSPFLGPDSHAPKHRNHTKLGTQAPHCMLHPMHLL